MIVLKGENLTKSYDGKTIIENINLCVKKGEMVSLLGVSGVGKSTLFNIMSGLESPDRGSVFLEGENVTGVAGKIGYMQQSDLLLPFKSVIKNVMIPLKLKGMKKNDAYQKALSILEEFSLSEYKDMYPCQLSGGMRQRVALARTFMTGCNVMLLDEPFSALDALTRAEVQKWFKEQIKKHNIATLFITHDIDEAIKLSDRIYVLAEDKLNPLWEVQLNEKTDAEILKKDILEKVR